MRVIVVYTSFFVCFAIFEYFRFCYYLPACTASNYSNYAFGSYDVFRNHLLLTSVKKSRLLAGMGRGKYAILNFTTTTNRWNEKIILSET